MGTWELTNFRTTTEMFRRREQIFGGLGQPHQSKRLQEYYSCPRILADHDTSGTGKSDFLLLTAGSGRPTWKRSYLHIWLGANCDLWRAPHRLASEPNANLPYTGLCFEEDVSILPVLRATAKAAQEPDHPVHFLKLSTLLKGPLVSQERAYRMIVNMPTCLYNGTNPNIID